MPHTGSVSLSRYEEGIDRYRDERWLYQVGKPFFARRVSWLYPDAGCEARSEIVCYRAKQSLVTKPYKLFANGRMKPKTMNHVDRYVTWGVHVAPDRQELGHGNPISPRSCARSDPHVDIHRMADAAQTRGTAGGRGRRSEQIQPTGTIAEGYHRRARRDGDHLPGSRMATSVGPRPSPERRTRQQSPLVRSGDCASFPASNPRTSELTIERILPSTRRCDPGTTQLSFRTSAWSLPKLAQLRGRAPAASGVFKGRTPARRLSITPPPEVESQAT